MFATHYGIVAAFNVFKSCTYIVNPLCMVKLLIETLEDPTFEQDSTNVDGLSKQALIEFLTTPTKVETIWRGSSSRLVFDIVHQRYYHPILVNALLSIIKY